MSSKCSLCGKSYKNLRLHEVKAHESFRITVTSDEEGDCEISIHYSAGSTSCELESGEGFDGDGMAIVTYEFPENTHPKYGGVAVQYPWRDKSKIKESMELFYASKKQMYSLSIDPEKLMKVSQDRITIV